MNQTHKPIILVMLACVLMLTSACGKKSIRGVSGVEDLFSSESNPEVAGGPNDGNFSNDPLVELGKILLEDAEDAWVDSQGTAMLAGGERGLTNDGDTSGQPEEALPGDGRTTEAEKALSAADLDHGNGGTTPVGRGQEGSSSIFSASTGSGGPGSSGGALGMGKGKGMARDQLAASGPSSGAAAAAHDEAGRKDTRLSQGLRDVFFAYDSWRLSEQSYRILESNAEWLKAHPHARVTIEGHCDERGTRAYNYVLGGRRAETARQYLLNLGVPVHQMVAISFGKDRPVCRVFDAECFKVNRRTHFSIDVNTVSRD